MKYGREIRYIIGIDEVGRGPLAGPVTVGACALPVIFPKKFFKNLKDSKKLSPQKREEWFKKINQEKKNGSLNYAISSVSSHIIDSRGLSYAINLALKRSLFALKLNPQKCFVYLDGGLKAPKEFIFQETIIKGDEKISAISLASIVAKVTRDKNMVKLGKKYPKFGFDVHKGYGTLAHRMAIKKYGPCRIHRKSFLGNANPL